MYFEQKTNRRFQPPCVCFVCVGLNSILFKIISTTILFVCLFSFFKSIGQPSNRETIRHYVTARIMTKAARVKNKEKKVSFKIIIIIIIHSHTYPSISGSALHVNNRGIPFPKTFSNFTNCIADTAEPVKQRRRAHTHRHTVTQTLLSARATQKTDYGAARADAHCTKRQRQRQRGGRDRDNSDRGGREGSREREEREESEAVWRRNEVFLA